MSALAFEDVHKHAATGHYIVPNEHMGIWLQMIDDLKLDKAASICSSGEVGFFALLPRVKEELLMLDHSYQSLAVAAIKYLLMNDLGVTQTRQLFACGDFEKIKAELTRVSSDLPEALLNAYRWISEQQYESFETHAQQIAREWKCAPMKYLRSAGNKLDKVTFLHGDLTDAASKGPFDLFYISNALEHRGRDGKRPIPDKVAQAVRPGGYVLACGRYAKKMDSGGFSYGESEHPEGWEIVHSIDLTAETDEAHGSFGGKIKWEHVLYKLPEAA